MYSSIFCIIIVFVLVHYGTSDCNSDYKHPKLKDAILRENLLCNYDKGIAVPLKNQSEIINVTVTLDVVSYSIETSFPIKLVSNHLLIVKWTDEFLSWNPADYDSISVIKMNTDDIWKPYVVPQEEEFFTGSESLMEGIECEVMSTGNVKCTLTTTHSGYCDNDSSYWPHDIHRCNIQYLLLGFSGEMLHVVEVDAEPIIFLQDKNNWEWKILNTTQEGFVSHPSSNFWINEIYFLFEFERYTENIMTEVYTSIFALVSITLMLFWVHPVTADRTILVAVNFISHLFYVQYIEWIVPKATSLPYILGFYSNSLLLSAIAMIESIILKQMIKSHKITPAWIFTLDRFTTIKRILLIDVVQIRGLTDEETGAAAAKDNQPLDRHSQMLKMCTAQIIDRIFFLSYAVIYLVEIITVMTLKSTLDYPL